MIHTQGSSKDYTVLISSKDTAFDVTSITSKQLDLHFISSKVNDRLTKISFSISPEKKFVKPLDIEVVTNHPVQSNTSFSIVPFSTGEVAHD